WRPTAADDATATATGPDGAPATEDAVYAPLPATAATSLWVPTDDWLRHSPNRKPVANHSNAATAAAFSKRLPKLLGATASAAVGRKQSYLSTAAAAAAAAAVPRD